MSEIETVGFMGQKSGNFRVDYPLTPVSGCNHQDRLLLSKNQIALEVETLEKICFIHMTS